jgi:hypothetical protein
MQDKSHYLALGLTMDALVCLTGPAPPTWTIEERAADGKHLGKIVQGGKVFSIEAEAEPLVGVNPGPYSDLGAAMSAVAQQIKGTCRLWSP